MTRYRSKGAYTRTSKAPPLTQFLRGEDIIHGSTSFLSHKFKKECLRKLRLNSVAGKNDLT